MNQYEVNRAAAINYLKSQDWNYDIRRDDGEDFLAKLGFSSSTKLKHLDLFVEVDNRNIISTAISPLNASVEDYDKVVEYITRANYGLMIGGFQFDYSDGEVRYRAGLASMSGTPDERDVERVVDLPLLMFRRYGDGLAKALMGFGDPEADIAAAEA